MEDVTIILIRHKPDIKTLCDNTALCLLIATKSECTDLHLHESLQMPEQVLPQLFWFLLWSIMHAHCTSDTDII